MIKVALCFQTELGKAKLDRESDINTAARVIMPSCRLSFVAPVHYLVAIHLLELIL
jgi:hypothetical protein